MDGPILGAVTPDSARIFGRGSEKKQYIGVARIRREGETEYSQERSFRVQATFDFTGVAVFSELEDLSRYTYQMGWVEQQDGSTYVDTQSFRTATANRQQKRSFVLCGSCCYLLTVAIRRFDPLDTKSTRVWIRMHFS